MSTEFKWNVRFGFVREGRNLGEGKVTDRVTYRDGS